MLKVEVACGTGRVSRVSITTITESRSISKPGTAAALVPSTARSALPLRANHPTIHTLSFLNPLTVSLLHLLQPIRHLTTRPPFPFSPNPPHPSHVVAPTTHRHHIPREGGGCPTIVPFHLILIVPILRSLRVGERRV